MAGKTHDRSDPAIGKALATHSFMVSDQMLVDYFEGLDLDPASIMPTGLAVPSMIAGLADNYHAESRYQQDRGHLWMRQEWELSSPLLKEEPYVAHAFIEDIYRRRDRTVVNTAMTLKNSAGEVVVSSNHHQSFLLDDPVENVEFRDPRVKEGTRKFSLPEGSPLESFHRVINLEMCGQFFHGSRSYHTDLKASQELGFQDIVVGGHMTMSYIGHLLEQHFGAVWWRGGKLDIKFTNPLWPDERITIKGIALDKGNDDCHESVFAWIEKLDGTKVLVANASVPVEVRE